MPRNLINHFDPDPALLATLRECMDNHGVGDRRADWPNNIISTRAIVYGSGRIARAGERIVHEVNPDELALCRRLAHDAAKVVAGVAMGMGSESSAPLREFFCAASRQKEPPLKLDEDLVRSFFGDTIFPLATVTVEPLEAWGVWWSEVAAAAGEMRPQSRLLHPWRNLIGWFRTQPDFADRAFVRIGDRRALAVLDRGQFPVGTNEPGSVLPRLVLGLTKQGSLAGLFGFATG